jgi:predicted RNase H-like HicB family nuclease
MTYNYTVALLKELDGRYTVVVPALPGCYTYGATVEQALDRAREAIQCHVTALLVDGDPIPADPSDFTIEMDEATEVMVKHVVAVVEEALIPA